MATTTKAPVKGPLVLTFDFEKDTPNTLRFKEQERPNDARAFVGSLYLTKEGVVSLGGKTTKIKVTIEAAG